MMVLLYPDSLLRTSITCNLNHAIFRTAVFSLFYDYILNIFFFMNISLLHFQNVFLLLLLEPYGQKICNNFLKAFPQNI